jgi:hypothetical protein
MDRSARSRTERPTAVRTARTAAFGVLLPAVAGECGEPVADAAARRTLSGMPVLRQSADGGHAGGKPQTHAAPDADFGNRSALSKIELEPPGAWPRGPSLPAAGGLDRAAQSSLEHRCYVCPDEGRLPVSGRHHGLVQSVCAQLGTHTPSRRHSSSPMWRTPMPRSTCLLSSSGAAVIRRRQSGSCSLTRSGGLDRERGLRRF